MPNILAKPDPAAFAARLHAAMEAAGKGGRGAGARLARRHSVKPPTASAWLAGTYMPTPAKVRVMAADYHVDYDWLYFGGPPTSVGVVAEDATAYALEQLTDDERALIEGYRLCAPAIQRNMLAILSALTKPAA